MKPAPCTRSLSEQAEDQTGSRRRGDHDLRRLDLLSDEELDHYRARFGSDALDASETLAEASELRMAKLEEGARLALEKRTEMRPILTVFVCTTCGTFEVARAHRAWAIDRAMRRSGLAERDVRAVLALLVEAGGGADLDHLSSEALRELRDLVGHDVDLECIRHRYVRS